LRCNDSTRTPDQEYTLTIRSSGKLVSFPAVYPMVGFSPFWVFFMGNVFDISTPLLQRIGVSARSFVAALAYPRPRMFLESMP
jgi:hypothetical protein